VPRLRRRGFLRLAAAAALLRPAGARAEEPASALGVHRATRNTWYRPAGVASWLRERPPPAKPYPGAARVPLPPPGAVAPATLAEVAAAARPAAPPPLSLEALATLLALTNGVTGVVRGSDPPEHRRAAPSAGALYAGEVYVAAERVAGLAPGVYAYAVAEHELVSLREGGPLEEVARAIEAPAAGATAAAAVLLTNVFARYAWRYGQRGYRYALIDSGHIGENLRLAATALGHAHTPLPRFADDALAALLGVDGRSEAVCALHLLDAAPAPRAAPAAPLAERGGAGGSGDAVTRYHEATKLAPRAGAAPPAPAPPHAAPASSEVAMPAGAQAVPGGSHALPVVRAIQQRRSALAFGDALVPAAAFRFALAQARSPRLGLRVVVHRVEGLAPGLYEVAADGALALREAGSFEGRLVRACLLQSKAAAAGAAFAFVAPLAAAPGEGERRYRDLLVEAGAAAQRLYLAAESLGLAARNLAAFFDDTLDALLHLDGRDHAVVHLTLLGTE
jgi:SagB-type dehydrogenase family enzyme